MKYKPNSIFDSALQVLDEAKTKLVLTPKLEDLLHKINAHAVDMKENLKLQDAKRKELDALESAENKIYNSRDNFELKFHTELEKVTGLDTDEYNQGVALLTKAWNGKFK